MLMIEDSPFQHVMMHVHGFDPMGQLEIYRLEALLIIIEKPGLPVADIVESTDVILQGKSTGVLKFVLNGGGYFNASATG